MPLLLILATSLALVGCDFLDAGSDGSELTPQVNQDSLLQSTTWLLREVSEWRGFPEGVIELDFRGEEAGEGQHQYYMTLFCNGGGGSYTLPGEQTIEILSAMSTYKGCGGVKDAAAGYFIRSLRAAHRFRIVGDELTLEARGGYSTLVFQASREDGS